MDFSNRTTQPQASAPGSAHAPAQNNGFGRKNTTGAGPSWLRYVTVGLAGALLLLLIALVVFLGFGSNGGNEDKYVDSSKLQAVFLNTGQVYFGKIKTLNSRYFVLADIYYLQTSSTGTTQSNANTSVSLVKLGCELHSPYDQMVINRTQVTFWENLQDSGQVAKAVATFQQQNPNGQKCSDQSKSGTAGQSNVQGSTSTTPSTTTTTKP